MSYHELTGTDISGQGATVLLDFERVVADSTVNEVSPNYWQITDNDFLVQIGFTDLETGDNNYAELVDIAPPVFPYSLAVMDPVPDAPMVEIDEANYVALIRCRRPFLVRVKAPAFVPQPEPEPGPAPEPDEQVPTVTLTAEPSEIEIGQSSTLTWRTEHATSVNATGFSPFQLNGSAGVTPSESTTYTIAAVGPGGATLASVTVLVREPAPPPAPEPEPIPNVVADLTNAVWLNLHGSSIPSQFTLNGDGLQVPQANGIHYVVHPGMDLRQVVAIRFAVEIMGDDAIVPVQAGDPPPAKLRLFIGTSDVSTAKLRFWSDPWLKIGNGTDAANPNPSGLGVHEMTAWLDWMLWHTVLNNEHNEAAFLAMLAAPQWIGFTCGGQFSDGHGIRANGNTRLAVRAYSLIGK
jgi:hypothetical protein